MHCVEYIMELRVHEILEPLNINPCNVWRQMFCSQAHAVIGPLSALHAEISQETQ